MWSTNKPENLNYDFVNEKHNINKFNKTHINTLPIDVLILLDMIGISPVLSCLQDYNNVNAKSEDALLFIKNVLKHHYAKLEEFGVIETELCS